MQCIWHDIAADRIKADDFVGFIEISKGSKMKYELDKPTGLIMVDRILSTSTQYPWSYGLIPRTYAPDGDPLDIIVISSEPIISGALAKCRPIGVMRMIDGGDQDDKIICVLPKDPMYNEITDIAQLPKHIGDEMMHFFSVYKQLEGKETETGPIEGPASAVKIVQECIDAYGKKYAKN